MKQVKYLISFFVTAAFLLGCAGDDSRTDVDDAAAPANLSAFFKITQDNSGKVTIYPNSEGATSYDVYFGDATAEPESMSANDASVDHIYAEGNYTVKIIAYGINGLQTEYTQPLSVSFVAPTDLQIIATPEPGNPYKKNFTAKATNETYFEIFYGETPGETPDQFNEGQNVSHTYANVGTYTIKVIAYSGGAATAETTTTVTVLDPIVMPVNFESASPYAFGDFGGVAAAVVSNPVSGGINTSAKVARIIKTPGAEVWAGTSLPLDAPIDFSTMNIIKMKVYSPVAGAVVKLKIENLSNANINVEMDAVTTTANQWETLTYTFSGINNANNYQRLVVFYDFGNNGNGATFYFDDIVQATGAPQVVLPLNFDNSALTYTFTGFGGANAIVANNPDATGLNTSAKVGKLTKNSGSEVWAGSFIELQQPIDFSTMGKIKMKVWSPQAGIVVKLKLENLSTPSINREVDATTTTSNSWEELTYDFSPVVNSNNYQRVVVFFNFGVAGTGASYYFDDIKLSN